ncbi:MAG: 4Fe-4S dicluster domain-containing protein [Clostridia bacterium]|nr:4Fe-4S dicluster domain-containing protein [Clostridia bacterium]
MPITKRPLTKAGSAQENKTGSWRKEHPVVDKNKCISCSLCAKLCPDNCIYMRETKKGHLIAEPNLDYCKGCGICAEECPVKAIRMVKD